ncbi:MAG: hypothetical protein K9L68_02375 [Spirochaetales bacterium]|nr:hypothetical protein [Spirochaetales bacterium]MCF7937422.1 hypothetical protein [Spirochaetales bacterium]
MDSKKTNRETIGAQAVPGISPNSRVQALIDRRDKLAREHKRDLYVDNPEFLVYHWSGEAEAFSPATGEHAAAEDKRINLGDHNCRVDIGIPFPYTEEMPSKKNGHSNDPENFGADYAFFMDHSPAEIHPHEQIVGEFHWQLDEARRFRYPEKQRELGRQARQLGAGGISFNHTTPDLSIGLSLGWKGLLEKIRSNRSKYEEYGNQQSVQYLNGAEQVALSISRFIARHAERAEELSAAESDPELKENYRQVAQTCRAISQDAPKTLQQAVQWIQFYLLADRIIGHGNGYGRLDQLLIDFYRNDLEEGRITREQARDYIAELYLKYGGNYFSFGGRNRELEDATNELSWIGLEAYDMTGGYNHLGVMWHPDMDPDFFEYACDVVGRHGAGTPTLVNYDVMRYSQLRSGVSEDDAWNISYSGCQWYCTVGNEYNDQDLNSLVLVQPMQRAMKRAAGEGSKTFDDFWQIYDQEVQKTADILRDFKNKTYEWQARIWPEIVTSFCMHGPMDKGKDVTDTRAVNNNYTSVNVLGVPNVSDSMYAIKKLVYEEGLCSMSELLEAVENDWEGREPLRRRFLNLPKFGNDIDEPDTMGIRVSEHIRETLESRRNIKGFHFRPSLFQYMGHTYAGPMLGATPDGRKAAEPLAHGMNPMHGRNTEGIVATANSFTKLDFRKYQGGSFQIELEPSFFQRDERRGPVVAMFAKSFFEKGGVQINLNVIDIDTLKDAMANPEKDEYQDIVVKVTGYSAHFVVMDRQFQSEFIQRVNYEDL